MNSELLKNNKHFVRSGIRTHAHISGLRPERSALDHSAILTYMIALYGIAYPMIKAKPIF